MMKRVNRKELVRRRVMSLTDGKDYGLCSPPMTAQTAVDELCRYFLGEDWYTAMPQSTGQVNSEIVYEIERLYRGNKWRDEYVKA